MIFSGEVRSLSTEGYGVVPHPEGKIFFVPGCWPGDRGSFEVESQGPRYGYARLKELETPSVDRIDPPCPHQGWQDGRCGGCPWMIGSYESQLRHKEHRVKHACERAGLLDEGTVLAPILGSPNALGYRNRAQFKTDGETMGFVSEGTNRIADVKDCLVLAEPLRERYRGLRAELPNPAWRPDDGRHKWNFFELDEEMTPQDPVVWNRRRPFRQGNTAQNARMRAWVGEKAKGSQQIIELFCGSGNFTEKCVESGAKKILAVEVADVALAQLRAREWPTVRTLAEDLSKPFKFARLAHELPNADLLVLDPPREGAKGVEKLVEALPRLRRVAYVSCDVATFVRDAVAIGKLGFRLAELQALDLFPQTSHVEVMGLFERAPK